MEFAQAPALKSTFIRVLQLTSFTSWERVTNAYHVKSENKCLQDPKEQHRHWIDSIILMGKSQKCSSMKKNRKKRKKWACHNSFISANLANRTMEADCSFSTVSLTCNSLTYHWNSIHLIFSYSKNSKEKKTGMNFYSTSLEKGQAMPYVQNFINTRKRLKNPMNDLLNMFIQDSVKITFLSTLAPLDCNSTYIFHCSDININQSSWKSRLQSFKTNDKTSLFPWVLTTCPIANTNISGYFCKPHNYTKITVKSFLEPEFINGCQFRKS